MYNSLVWSRQYSVPSSPATVLGMVTVTVPLHQPLLHPPVGQGEGLALVGEEAAHIRPEVRLVAEGGVLYLCEGGDGGQVGGLIHQVDIF